MRRLVFNDRRLLVLAALVILVLLMMNFSNRLGDLLRLNTEKKQLQSTVDVLASTEQSLETQIAYATSEVAIIEKARSEERMIQPGDIPVVPIAPPGSTPIPTLQPVSSPTEIQNWQRWYALFFGEK
jgi:cell division protein FtsB